MDQNNNSSELETQLSSIAIDAVRSAMKMNLSPQEKEQIIKDAKAYAQRLPLGLAEEHDLDSKADL